MTIVNQEQYPIHAQGEGRTELINSSIQQLEEDGFVCLSNFIQGSAIDELTASILELEKSEVGYYSTETHNVFLEEEDDSFDSSSLNPRSIKLQSSKLILNAQDMRDSTLELNRLFTSATFLDFISSILKTRVYPSVDPYGKYYANIYHEKDGLNWHLDRSEFSVSLTLQPSEKGGEFQFAPNSRSAVEKWNEMPFDTAHVRRLLHDDGIELKEPRLMKGDLYIFQGHQSLHRVSPVETGTRINIILTFNAQPDAKLNDYTLQKFFGVAPD